MSRTPVSRTGGRGQRVVVARLLAASPACAGDVRSEGESACGSSAEAATQAAGTSLPAGASPGNIPEGLLQPSNSFGLFGGDPNQYGGPAPPPGTKAHEYRFILYALDVPTLGGVTAESDFSAVTSAMAGHVLATTTLSGYVGH